MPDAEVTAEFLAARGNLRLLAILRAIAVAAQTATVFATRDLLHVPLDLELMLVPIGLLAALDAATFVRLRISRHVTHGELCAQLLADVAALTALLYLAGGATNPFGSCYLLLVIFAASTLPERYVWALAAACVAAYTFLQLAYVPLPLPDSFVVDRNLNASALWVMYALLAALVVWFGGRINTLRREHGRLAEREAQKDARDRYLLGLATRAAGTAHEMSTPLSTMAVVIGDLRHAETPPADWRMSVDVLWKQIQICKESLAEMVNSADVERLGALRNVPARQFIEELVDRFQLLRPQSPLIRRYADIDAALTLRADDTLTQALLNFIGNAVDASPAGQFAELHASQHESALILQIYDRGPGLPPNLRAEVGRRAFSTKPPGRGCGIGLFIANSAVERFGGSVAMFDREGGGTCVRVELPAYRISAGMNQYERTGPVTD